MAGGGEATEVERMTNLMVPGDVQTPVLTNTATFARARAIYIGVDARIDINLTGVGGTWVEYLGAKAGTILPLQAFGVRVSGAAPTTGQINLLN